MRVRCGANFLAAVATLPLTALMMVPIFAPFYNAVPALPLPQDHLGSGQVRGEPGHPGAPNSVVQQPPPQGPAGQGTPPTAGVRGDGPELPAASGAPLPRISFSMLPLPGKEREGIEGPGIRAVHALSCAEDGGQPEAFCRKVVPAIALWAAALPMVWMTALGLFTRGNFCPSCLSESSSIHLTAASAVLGLLAIIASIVTLDWARHGIAAEEHPGRLEVGCGWALYVAGACGLWQLVAGIAFAHTSLRGPSKEQIVDGEPMPATGIANATAGTIVVGQPVSDGFTAVAVVV